MSIISKLFIGGESTSWWQFCCCWDDRKPLLREERHLQFGTEKNSTVPQRLPLFIKHVAYHAFLFRSGTCTVYLPDKFKGEESLNHEFERWGCFMNNFWYPNPSLLSQTYKKVNLNPLPTRAKNTQQLATFFNDQSWFIQATRTTRLLMISYVWGRNVLGRWLTSHRTYIYILGGQGIKSQENKNSSHLLKEHSYTIINYLSPQKMCPVHVHLR